jgi:hypothetical protein
MSGPFEPLGLYEAALSALARLEEEHEHSRVEFLQRAEVAERKLSELRALAQESVKLICPALPLNWSSLVAVANWLDSHPEVETK